MSLEKAEARAAGMHEVGMRMDDLLEAAQTEIARFEGAALGLLQASKAVQQLAGHVDDDIKEGRYEGLEPLKIAEVVKRYISRAAQVVENLAHNAKNQQIQAAGQVAGLQSAVAITKKMFDAEKAKGEAIAQAVAEIAAAPQGAEVDLRRRPEGVHPGSGIKAQRLAEEALAREIASTPEISQVVPISPKNGKGKRRRKG